MNVFKAQSDVSQKKCRKGENTYQKKRNILVSKLVPLCCVTLKRTPMSERIRCQQRNEYCRQSNLGLLYVYCVCWFVSLDRSLLIAPSESYFLTNFISTFFVILPSLAIGLSLEITYSIYLYSLIASHIHKLMCHITFDC